MHFSALALALFAVAPQLGSTAPAASKSINVKATSSSNPSPAATGGAANNGTAGNNTPSDIQIGNAVLSWMNDTGKVTNFLNKATSFSGDEYTRQATIAFNAELDELNHKKVLDTALGTNAMVQTAN